MIAEVAAKWTAKLRSGEIEQCHGQLRQGDAMCALGVLCEVVGSKWDGDAATGTTGAWSCRSVLPPDVVFAAGMASAVGAENKPDGQCVMNLNDDEEWDFNQIADWIDAHAEEL